MKRWVGRWIIVVSAIHTVFALAIFGNVLAAILKRGVFNTVGNDPMTGAVVWFVLFGAMLFIYGLLVDAIEKNSSGQLPENIGWSLLAIGIIGIVLMPASGFWLIFPPAIAVITKKNKTRISPTET